MVYFVGAGPGDAELITVKGQKLLQQADVIIYAGSLVSRELLKDIRADALVFDSASMTLPQVLSVMEQYRERCIVRLHTGDPSIYGAIREQMDGLDELGISYQVIPGVSSFTAAAAAIKKEFTLPGVAQTVILTRAEGRTPVPRRESIQALASHQASMAIFLSVGMMDKVTGALIEGGYPADTPVAVVEKATWEGERVLYGTLTDIGEKVKQAGITKHAQILVGAFLGDQYEKSKLYDAAFTHGYRQGIPE